jgi:hypothetical protein
MSVDLFGRHSPWIFALCVDVVHHFRPFIFCEEVAKHVLNLLLPMPQITWIPIIVRFGCAKDLLLVCLVGSLKMEFNFVN